MMRWRNTGLKPSPPRTRFIHSTSFDVPPMFLHMFQEDVTLYVTPIGGSRHNKRFTIVFDGADAEVERAQAIFSLLADNSYKATDAVVADSIRDIASHLMYYGTAAFEILPAERDERKDFFVLHPIQPDSLRRIPGGYLQIIRKTEWTRDAPRFVYVPQTAVWRLKPPALLGGESGFRRTRKILSRITGFPKFAQLDLAEGKRFEITYDVGEFTALTRSTVLRATRIWGWIGRDHSLDHETEFYSVHRQITFYWATATLREEILSAINRLYSRLGIAVSLRIAGLLTPSEILDIRHRFTAGQLDIARALKELRTAETDGDE
jgi:hypothetical protein